MTDSPTPLLQIDDVSVRFGAQEILSHISLSIPTGQTLVVIGESGCGKTVTLKLIVGLMRPSEGKVLFEGREIAAMSDKELTRTRLRIGFLFQGAALFDSLNVYDNVAFGPRAQGVNEQAVRERVMQRLEDVGLRPSVVEYKMPSELSGGMKKRVGLARALALDPEVMLYDEPTTGLDPIMTDVINELILQTRRKRSITSVVITHEMKTVRKVADRVVMFYPLARLGRGEQQVLFDGTVDELDACPDPRVREFVEGDASKRLQEPAE